MQRNFFKENWLFLSGWLFITVLFGGFLLSYDKADSFIILNPCHNSVLDIIFRITTFLGDGIFIVALAVLFFILRRKRLSIFILSSYGFSGLIVQLLKHFFPADRPKLYFENHLVHYEYFLNDITLHTINSFPSGHTTSAFALAAALSFTSKNKSASLVYLIIAMLVGYSRIYLGQHFPEDVIAGSAIGVFSAVVCYWVIDLFYARKLRKNQKVSSN